MCHVLSTDKAWLPCRPQTFGRTPITRFRHTAVAVTPEPSSNLASLVESTIHPLQQQLQQGSVVLIYGGYNTMGQEFGADNFEVGLLMTHIAHCVTVADTASFSEVTIPWARSLVPTT